MSKRLTRGRYRNAGRPKFGRGQAAEKRYHRAVKRLNEDFRSFRVKHLKDMKAFLKYRLLQVETSNRGKYLYKIEENIEMAEKKMKARKVSNEAKRTAKKADAPKAADKAEKFAEVITKLRAGEEVPGYTLIKGVEKAQNNQTVEFVVELEGEQVLCRYK